MHGLGNPSMVAKEAVNSFLSLDELVVRASFYPKLNMDSRGR